jgi:transcription termination/antitermination protein NusA
VGVRGNRIKNIVDELAGERIDIVRWSDDLQVLIPNALQPAEVEEVILCQMLGRAIVLVREDQLSLAIGRRGQNVRLASKLCGWDIEIMTREELGESIERAVAGFSSLEGGEDSLSEKLVGEGFLSYDDLSIIEPDALMEMGDLSEEQANTIIAQAEVKAQEAEQAAAVERRRQREQDRIDAATAAAEAAEQAARVAEGGDALAPAVEAPAIEAAAVEAAAVESSAGAAPAGESPTIEAAAEDSVAGGESSGLGEATTEPGGDAAAGETAS